MQEFRYSFKYSLLLVLLVFTSIPLYYFLKGEEWHYLALYPVAFFVVILNQFFTRYYLDEEKLVVKDLFHKKEIRLEEVRKVQKLEMNWFHCFLSGRPKTSIRLVYKKFEDQEVFPANTDKFLDTLENRISPEAL
ncbi:MAG: PH domain-containing protein [Gillisia sp.]